MTYLIGYAIAGVIAFWVATDAKQRGMNSAGWAVGTFLLCIVFLPLYLIMRKPLLTEGVPQAYPPQGYPPQAYQQAPPTYPPAPAPQAFPPAAAPQGTTLVCAACGQSFPGPAAFCPHCGHAVQSS